MSTVQIKKGGKAKDYTKEVYDNMLKDMDKTDVYLKMHQMIADPEVDIYIECRDKYLREAFSKFLKDLNFKMNESVDPLAEGHLFIYIDLRNYTFTFKEVNESEFEEDGKEYGIEAQYFPNDWNIACLTITNYLDEKPVPVKEIITSDEEQWSNPVGWDDVATEDSNIDNVVDINSLLGDNELEVVNKSKNIVFAVSTTQKDLHIAAKNELHAAKIAVACNEIENENDVIKTVDISYYYYDDSKFTLESIDKLKCNTYGIITSQYISHLAEITIFESPIEFSDEEIQFNIVTKNNDAQLNQDDEDFDTDSDDADKSTFIFSFGSDDGELVIYISPKEHFDKTGHGYDQHIAERAEMP